MCSEQEGIIRVIHYCLINLQIFESRNLMGWDYHVLKSIFFFSFFPIIFSKATVDCKNQGVILGHRPMTRFEFSVLFPPFYLFFFSIYLLIFMSCSLQEICCNPCKQSKNLSPGTFDSNIMELLLPRCFLFYIFYILNLFML